MIALASGTKDGDFLVDDVAGCKVKNYNQYPMVGSLT
jgi:hypothetical protein